MILLAAPLLFGSGCATHALWKESNLDAWNEPADDPHLRLFDTPRHKDVLVVYDEYSERHDSVHQRGYWLMQNQKRIEQRRRPEFVEVLFPQNLTPIPVFVATNAPETGSSPPGPYAVVSTNLHSFILYSASNNGGPYRLPVYNDGSGQAARIALTPLAVLADLTIIGGFIAAEIWAGGGFNSVH